MVWITCGLLWCFINRDSHSDGTHSLQSIHCWASDLFQTCSDEEIHLTSWLHASPVAGQKWSLNNRKRVVLYNSFILVCPSASLPIEALPFLKWLIFKCRLWGWNSASMAPPLDSTCCYIGCIRCILFNFLQQIARKCWLGAFEKIYPFLLSVWACLII